MVLLNKQADRVLLH